MGVFQNKFFSLAGQKERLQNVAGVLKTVINPFKGDKLTGQGAVGGAVAKVLSTRVSKAVVAGGLVAGATGLAIKAVSAIKGASAVKKATTIPKKPVVSKVPGKAGIGATLLNTGGAILQGRPNQNTPVVNNPQLMNSPAVMSTEGPAMPSQTGILETMGIDNILGNTGQNPSILGNTSSSGLKVTSRRRTSRRRNTSKRRAPKSSRRKSRRRGKKRYGTARQYARKGGKKVHYTKNGQPYILLASGKARFVKGRRKK